MTTVQTGPSKSKHTPASPRTLSGAELIAPLTDGIKPVRTPILYRLSLLVVTLTMIVLPLVYMGLIVLLGWGVYLHTITNPGMITAVRGRGAILALALYLAPIIGGGVAILFMIKPFFAPRAHRPIPLSLQRQEQPVLFAFVDQLCKAVGAPAPRRIDVNCDVNAAAGFRRGMLSFFGSDLVLIIGLPLAAGLSLRQFAGVLAHEFGHFAQGGAMRLTYIIRTISAWFARVVYERDSWDEALDSAASGDTHISIMIVVWVTKLVVWFSRRVLWVLMYIGHAVSCFMLRQMEYDADRHETRLAGSDTFEATVMSLMQLNMASNAAMSDARQTWASGMLPDDLPALMKHHARRIPAEIEQKVRTAMLERRTGFFDTHPADRDRIASAKREDTPGIFRLDVPARVLFRDFDKICRVATGFHYKAVLDEAYDRAKLVPTANLVKSQASDDEAAESLTRCFRGALRPTRPVWPDAAAWRKPADDAVRQALEDIRRKLAAATSHARKLVSEFDAARERLITVRRAGRLQQAGFARIDAGSFGLSSTAPGVVQQAINDAATKERDTGDKLDAFNKAAMHRMTLTLRLLHSPTGDAVPDAVNLRRESDALAQTLTGLSTAYASIQSLSEDFDLTGTLLNNIQGSQPNMELVKTALAELTKVASRVNSIASQLSDVMYPFDHAAGEITISRFAMDRRPDPKDIGQTMTAASDMLERLTGLYMRCMARLARICEQVEEQMGMGPVAMPENADG